MNAPPTSIHQHFAVLRDPRVERTKDHPVLASITIALTAIIGGADSWGEGAAFGNAKRAWLRTCLALPHGSPAHDPVGRVCAALDPLQFQPGFLRWVQAGTARLPGLRDHIARAGTTRRGWHDRPQGRAAIELVSAWSAAHRLGLGQVQVAPASNESTALPGLIPVLDLRDCLVTIDAIGGQTAIVDAIVAQGGDQVLALTGNPGSRHQEVVELFAQAPATGLRGSAHATYQTLEQGPGRLEERRWWTIDDPAQLAQLNPPGAWRTRVSVTMGEAARMVGETVSRATRYDLASVAGAQTVGEAARGHWAIEKSVPWVLDIAFREDESRVRQGHSAATFAVVRHLALNRLRADQTTTIGVKANRLKAGWDEAYLERILRHLNQ